MKKTKTELTREEIMKRYFAIENDINALSVEIDGLTVRELGKEPISQEHTNFSLIVHRIKLLKEACDNIHE